MNLKAPFPLNIFFKDLWYYYFFNKALFLYYYSCAFQNKRFFTAIIAESFYPVFNFNENIKIVNKEYCLTKVN